jgi:LPS O-antigen subunit length determinant protein (WzzB/FepE family)
MKRRDIITIIISLIIVLVVAALLYQYIAPPTKNSGIKYEVPHAVNPNFNQDQLKVLKNDVTDYSQNISPK